MRCSGHEERMQHRGPTGVRWRLGRCGRRRRSGRWWQRRWGCAGRTRRRAYAPGKWPGRHCWRCMEGLRLGVQVEVRGTLTRVVNRGVYGDSDARSCAPGADTCCLHLRPGRRHRGCLTRRNCLRALLACRTQLPHYLYVEMHDSYAVPPGSTNRSKLAGVASMPVSFTFVAPPESSHSSPAPHSNAWFARGCLRGTHIGQAQKHRQWRIVAG